MKKLLTAILTTLGISASVIGVDQACLIDEVVLQAAQEKICFSTQEDYETFREGVIKIYRETDIYAYTKEWHLLMAVLNEESKGKTITVTGRGEDVIEEILQDL